MAYSTVTQHPKKYPYTSIMAGPYNGDPTGAIDCAAGIETFKADNSNVGTLHIPKGTFLIGTNLTIPVGVRLHFEAGAQFSISNGVTLTINGTILATENQAIFTGAGTVVSAQVLLYSSWFATFAMAVSSMASGSTLSLLPGAYSVTTDTTIPAGSTLQIQNGALITIATTKTLTINGTLDAGVYQIFSCTGTGKVTFGSGAVKEVYPEWWGATRDGATDDSTPVNAALASNCGKVVFQSGTYVGNFTLPNDKTDLMGQGPKRTVLQSSAGAGTILTLDTDDADDGDWQYKKIYGISFIGANGTTRTSKGITFGTTGVNYYYKGRIHVENCHFNNLDMAVYKQYGNFGNRISNCDFETCNYHYYVEADSVVSQGGTELIENNQFRDAKIVSQFINDSSVQHTYLHNIWETNPGFVFYVYNYTGAFPYTVANPGIKLVDCYIEDSATAGAVNVLIAGVPTASTTVEYYFRNCPNVILDNTPLARMTLVNSIISGINTDNRSVEALGEAIVADAASAVIVNGVNVAAANSLDYFAASIHRASQNRYQTNTSTFWTSPRRVITRDGTAAKYIATFAKTDTFAFEDALANPYTGTIVADGVIFDSCCEIAVPADTTIYVWPHPGINVAIPLNDYIVWSIDAIRVSGGDTKVYLGLITNPAGFSLKDPATHPGWHTYAGVAQNTDGNPLAAGTGKLYLIGDGTGGTVRVSAHQVMSFARLEDALAYFNSGLYCASGDIARVLYSTTYPTTGTWAVGDRIWNTAPAATGIAGWVCTTAGAAPATAKFAPIATGAEVP